jgi:hypothetical protein
MTHTLASLLVPFLLPTASAATDGVCRAWEAPAPAASVDDDKVNQVSGIVASHRYPGLIWAEEDAGSDPELIAIDSDGTKLNRVTVTGAENEDWEDITLGPCPTDTTDACGCLYLGDLGSNDGTRAEGVVWVVPEPSPLDNQTAPATALRFAWPDGPHDAEALFVHPVTGVITVITKETTGPARLYRFPGTALTPSADTVELLALGTLDLEAAGSTGGRVTGGAISPLGDRLVLRTSADALLFSLGAADVGAALQGDAERVVVHESAAGEAITFTPDGERLLLVDEGPSPTVWQVACADFEATGTVDPDPLGACDAATDPPGCACDGSAPARGGGFLAGFIATIVLRRRR